MSPTPSTGQLPLPVLSSGGKPLPIPHLLSASKSFAESRLRDEQLLNRYNAVLSGLNRLYDVAQRTSAESSPRSASTLHNTPGMQQVLQEMTEQHRRIRYSATPQVQQQRRNDLNVKHTLQQEKLQSQLPMNHDALLQQANIPPLSWSAPQHKQQQQSSQQDNVSSSTSLRSQHVNVRPALFPPDMTVQHEVHSPGVIPINQTLNMNQNSLNSSQQQQQQQSTFSVQISPMQQQQQQQQNRQPLQSVNENTNQQQQQRSSIPQLQQQSRKKNDPHSIYSSLHYHRAVPDLTSTDHYILNHDINNDADDQQNQQPALQPSLLDKPITKPLPKHLQHDPLQLYDIEDTPKAQQSHSSSIDQSADNAAPPLRLSDSVLNSSSSSSTNQTTSSSLQQQQQQIESFNYSPETSSSLVSDNSDDTTLQQYKQWSILVQYIQSQFNIKQSRLAQHISVVLFEQQKLQSKINQMNQSYTESITKRQQMYESTIQVRAEKTMHESRSCATN
jgi:hypothetical protein